MKPKLSLFLSFILTLISLAPAAQALTIQEILQGYDNPTGEVLGATTNGLVGYWNFDEGTGTTAADSSGSGNNGTLVNGSTWTAGKVGNGALQFDGVDDSVNAGTDSAY